MSKIINFFANFSPFWPRMNRASYIKNSLMIIVFVFIFALVYVMFFGISTEESASQDQILQWASIITGCLLMFLWIRRNHDMGISGWWILVGNILIIYSLIICFIPGTKWPNKYWPDPLEKLKKSKVILTN